MSPVKKISIAQLKPGMFIHDLNCGWTEHPFMRNHFAVRDAAVIQKLYQHGIREVYIDTGRGLDISDAPDILDVQHEIKGELDSISREVEAFKTAALAEEMTRARTLRKEAARVIRAIVESIRLGKQIEMERVEPLVEGIIDSIFRNQDALLPLCRLKSHDGYTFEHSVSVCVLMISFARCMNMPRETIRQVATGALLHDVGKARISDEILHKPARLTDAEFAHMQSHVVQGVILLLQTPGISDIALNIVAQHHERYDGSGYPNRLERDEIDIYGQMGSIVDVYDAITSDRPYHKGMPATQALGKMLEWSKHHFNPDLVRTYIKSVGIYPTGSLVRLMSERLAVVIEQNENKTLLPVVKAIYHAKRQHYLEPVAIDLSKPNCQDEIVSHESFEKWGIDPNRWCFG